MRAPIGVVIAILWASVSQASIVFKSSSYIPSSVQQQIANRIQEKCPEAKSQGWSFIEKATDVRYDRESNYFTTDFDVYARSKSSQQVKSGLLKVETVQILPSESSAGGIMVQSLKGLCR